MKKIIVIIIILTIIFSGMIIYKNIAINASYNISIQEINQIETYITKIYMWKEITNEALPEFENINQADEMWMWEVVKKNLEDYELSYEQIQEKAQELFGSDLTKEFPKEGTQYLVYDKETNKYQATNMGLDQEEDTFLLNTINKTEDGYEVQIVEYLEDYSQTINGEESIIIRNTQEEEIGKISTSEPEQAKEFVKSNIDKFSQKKLKLKMENQKLHIVMCQMGQAPTIH